MELLRATIRQFRSIKELTLPLDDENCIILLGINETGKSNILRALALLSKTETATPDDLRQVRHDEPEIERADVEFNFQTSNDDIAAFVKAFHERTRGLAGDLRLQAGGEALDFESFARRFAARLPYTVDVIRNSRRQQIWSYQTTFTLEEGWLVPSEKCPTGHQVTVPGVGGVQMRSLPIIHTSKRGADMPDEFIRAATAKEVEALFMNVIITTAEARLPECIAWSFSKDSVLPPSTQLNDFIQNPAAFPVLKNMFELADIDDIAGAFRAARTRTNGVRALLDRVGKRVSVELQQLWTDKAVSVVLTENGPSLESAIQDVHGVFDFQRRSDGFRRFASFMFMVSARARAGKLENAILLYDEPDASLHPAAARQLRRELLRLSERCKVVYSTHSIFMVDADNVGRHYLVKRTNEETAIERAQPSNIVDEEVLYQAVGHSIFADLKPMNLLLEGYFDRRLLEVALKAPGAESHATALAKIGRCHTRGVKNVGWIASMLDLKERSYFILTDNDPVALQHRGEYSGPAPWRTYAELVGDKSLLTAEDLVKPDVVLAAMGEAATKFEELKGSIPAALSEDIPVIRQLEEAVRLAKTTKERGKGFTRAVKDVIFERLTPTDLRPSALKLVEALAAAISSTAPSAQ